MKSRIALLLVGALAASAPALQFQNVLWDRAFSPNGDGVQDATPITFLVQSADTLRTLEVLVAASSAVPPAPESVVEELYLAQGSLGLMQNIHLQWDGLDALGEPHPDGFYFLHLHAVSDSDTLWKDPPGEIEINTVAPSFLSVAVEPQPFTPLKAGADTMQQAQFSSADFDTLTDTAILEIFAFSDGGESYSIRVLERDPDYALGTGEGVRYRFLWDGRDDAGARSDGLYEGRIRLEDDAGNGVETALSLDLDVNAPSFTVLGQDGWTEGATRFDFHPELLPDSLWVRASDRHGADSCKVAWGAEAPFDTLGTVAGQGDDYADFVFVMPAHWDADSSYRIRLDARDGAGQWKSELGSPTTLTVVLDSQAPAEPTWLSEGGTRIQAFQELRGRAGEADLSVFLYLDGGETPVDTTETGGDFGFVFTRLLEAGEQSFRVGAADAAGNLSGLSPPLLLHYRPGAAIRMPGRFRDDGDEPIQVNTPGDAARVELRFFSLDGALLRVLEAEGGPREWSVHWDRRDSEGRRPAPGLLVVVVRSELLSGERIEERKVVALVD